MDCGLSDLGWQRKGLAPARLINIDKRNKRPSLAPFVLSNIQPTINIHSSQYVKINMYHKGFGVGIAGAGSEGLGGLEDLKHQPVVGTDIASPHS